MFSCVFQIEVIEEAIKYIAYLQATLSSRFEEATESKFEEKMFRNLAGKNWAHILNLGNFFSQATTMKEQWRRQRAKEGRKLSGKKDNV